MDDHRTNGAIARSTHRGYEDAIVVPEITTNNFEIKHGLLNLVQNKQFFGHDKEDPHAHIRYFNKITSTIEDPKRPKLHQLDTFYNALNSNDQDSLNSAAGGNFLDKMPRECLKIIESKSKVRQSRSKAIVSKVSTSSSTPAVSSDVAELKDMVRALILDKKNQTPAPASVKAIEQKMNECLALADLGASINLMPLSIWKELSLPALTKTRMILELADRTISTPTGIAEDVFVKVGTFFFPADFVVVDYVADPRAPLILGRPFLRTARALIDVHGEQMTLRHDDQSVTFKVGDTKTLSYNIIETVNRVDVIDIACEEYVQEVLETSESGNPTSTSDLTIDSRSPSFTPFGGSDFLMEEIDEFLERDDSIPPGVDGIYDSEGDTVYLEELLSVINSDPNLPPSPVCEINVPEKIPIDPLDQEKTTFTCPYGHLPIVAALWLSMHRARVPKCHFMVKEGIVLGHKISKSGIEVDKAKVDVIAKLPHPTTVKEIPAISCHVQKYSVLYDHPALKYLLAKQDAKPRLLRWILLLQEFDVVIRDKKGAENLAADHLSRLENPQPK
ncbi:reverse transcriptase domain-containing protein [Tanacetum coccineum]